MRLRSTSARNPGVNVGRFGLVLIALLLGCAGEAVDEVSVCGELVEPVAGLEYFDGLGDTDGNGRVLPGGRSWRHSASFDYRLIVTRRRLGGNADRIPISSTPRCRNSAFLNELTGRAGRRPRSTQAKRLVRRWLEAALSASNGWRRFRGLRPLGKDDPVATVQCRESEVTPLSGPGSSRAHGVAER